jgi:hypothetical protein
LLGTGYVTACLFPIVGFVIGIVVMAKGRSGHGASMMLLSIIAFVIYAEVLTPDTPTYVYGSTAGGSAEPWAAIPRMR